jgi:hypothetical protein
MTTRETQILNAIERLADASGCTALTRLRAELPDLGRADLDQALLDMDNARQLQLEPNPHRLALTADDRASAIWLGGEDMHLVCTL